MKQNWRAGTMISPVPAVMVSCGDIDGQKNIITIAWTGTICSEPAMCYISVRKERHSYDMIRKSGEFVINLTTRALARATDWCGVRSGRDFDKFEYCGLTAERCNNVSAPAIAESPINIECKVKQVIELGSHDMFIAEVVGVMIDDTLLDAESGKLDLSRAELLGYAHGEYYALGEKLGTFGWTVKGSTIKKEKREKR
ncbi:MAG: flavin reductase family protein [Alistipes sp.]|nr:flavin reductase family protein [Alistipes sp.]MBQ6583927.1 flavin reductase family protein [Alistipes sp.]MEE0915457.1 flavin reductase family protein [Alistipes sp.]